MPSSQLSPTSGPRGTAVHVTTVNCDPDYSTPGGHFVHFFDSYARAHPEAGAFVNVPYTVSGSTVQATWTIPNSAALGQALFTTACKSGNGTRPFEVTG